MATSEPALPPRVFLYGSQPDLMLSGGKPTSRPASHDNARGAAIAVKPDFEYRAVRAGSGLPDDDSMAASGQIPPADREGPPTALGSIAEIQTDDTDKKRGGLRRTS